MNYLERLNIALEEKGYGRRYKKICLGYAEKLINNNMPVIFDIKHLSLALGVESNTLGYYVAQTDRFYSEKYIPKKSGGIRNISMPSYNLKKIQRWILENVLENIKVSEFSTGFLKGKSIIDNAIIHVNKDVVINIDIENFFPTIKFEKIFRLFYHLGYTKEVSYTLTKLITHKGQLPQGSPASPYIANIILYNLDKRIGAICEKNKASYTRYADDITISGDEYVINSISFIKNIIISEGFKLNDKKLKVQFRTSRQEVTGLVVNNSVKVKKEFKKKLRQELYYCKKYGIYNHLKYVGAENKSFYKEYLYGHAYFIYMVEPNEGEKFLTELNLINWNN